jgi:hypothetical protein
MRTLVWMVGLGSLALNLIALSHLDFLNVLLLLPSLLFSVSALIGPFLMSPKKGHDLGAVAWIPRALGWICGGFFYTVVAGLMARSSSRWWGVTLLALCFGGLALYGLRYFGYASSLKRRVRHLQKILLNAGLDKAKADKLGDALARNATADAEKTKAALQQGGVLEAHRDTAWDYLRDQIQAWVRRPLVDGQSGPFSHSRFFSEWSRSWVLSLFTLLWFFVVPIPGLLVLTAFDYRISMTLTGVNLAVAGLIGMALLARACAAWQERWLWNGFRKSAARKRLESLYHHFKDLRGQPGKLVASQIAHLYALFTDAQTYCEQRGFAYASRCLNEIEEILTRPGRRL